MCLPCVRPFEQLRHSRFPSLRWPGHSVLEGFIEAGSIRHWLRACSCIAEIPKIVDSHAGHYDEDVLVAEVRDCLTETVMLVRIIEGKERNLNNRHAERVTIRIKYSSCCSVVELPRIDRAVLLTNFETRPNPMIEASGYRLSIYFVGV